MGDTAESAAAGYTAGLFGPFNAEWVIGPTAAGWQAVRRKGAGTPMAILRDTARDLANRLAEEQRAKERLAEEELAEQLRAAAQDRTVPDQGEA